MLGLLRFFTEVLLEISISWIPPLLWIWSCRPHRLLLLQIQRQIPVQTRPQPPIQLTLQPTRLKHPIQQRLPIPVLQQIALAIQLNLPIQLPPMLPIMPLLQIAQLLKSLPQTQPLMPPRLVLIRPRVMRHKTIHKWEKIRHLNLWQSLFLIYKSSKWASLCMCSPKSQHLLLTPFPSPCSLVIHFQASSVSLKPIRSLPFHSNPPQSDAIH